MMPANNVAHVTQQQTPTPADFVDQTLGQNLGLDQAGPNGLDLRQEAPSGQQAMQAPEAEPVVPDYVGQVMQNVETGENLQNTPQRPEQQQNTATGYAKNLATFAQPQTAREDIVSEATLQTPASQPAASAPVSSPAASEAAAAAIGETDQSGQPGGGSTAGEEEAQAASAYQDFTDRNIVGLGNQLVSWRSTEDTEAMIRSQGREISRKTEDEGAEEEEAEQQKEASLGTQSDARHIEDNDDDESNLSSVPERTKAPKRPREIYAPSNTFYTEAKAQKEQSKKEVANKQWDGNAFTEKAVASRDVEPYAVSVGSTIIREMIREPGNNLVDIVNAASGGTYTQEQLLFDETAFQAFITTINNEQIYVIAVKSPVQQPASSQARVLRVHYGRGVAVHPTQTTSYNLDFDGDGVTIQLGNLDENKVFRTSMEYLSAIDGSHNIDEKFFPWPKLGTSDRGEYRDRFKQLFLADVYKRADTTHLADALYDIAYPAEGADKDELYERFVEELDALARPGWRRHDRDLSDMLMNIFDVSVYIDELTQASHFKTEAGADYIDGQRLSDQVDLTADGYVSMQISEMAVGKLPPNFQDFLIGLNRYIGEIDDANVMFRLGADVAKRIKFSSQTVMGKEGAWELYQHTLEAGMAMYMSSRASIGERVNHIQQMARKYIIEAVGFPYMDEYGSPQEFLGKFAANYNYFMAMVNAAKGNYDDTLVPIKDNFFGREDSSRDNLRIGDNVSIDDYAKALKMVYGEYTVGKVFGNRLRYSKSISSGGKHGKANSVLKRYQSYSISKLCRTNLIPVYERETKLGRVGFTDIFLALADQRTALTSKFNRELEDLLHNWHEGLKDYEEHYKRRNESPADYSAYANDLMFAMHLSGPEMFSYFDMTDASKFINSKWGKLFKKVVDTNAKKSSVNNAKVKITERENRKKDGTHRKTEEEIGQEARENALGGVRMSMVVEYRLRNVSAVNRAITQILAQDEITEADAAKINRLQNRMVSELNALGSSSDLWEILVKEIDGDNSVYQSLIADHEVKGNLFYDDLDFWDSKRAKKYNGLLGVLRDPDLSKIEKELIAVDCLRRYTGFGGFKAFETSYQLEIGPRSNFTSVATMAYRDDPDILDDLQESNNRLKQFFNSNWDEIKKDVAKARAAAKITGPGTLDNYVQELAANPQLYLQIDDNAVVDAINAQMDKTSRASEKAHQEIPVNWLYEALSLQKGGYTNVMHRVFDRSLGALSSQTISAYDLIQVLADPTLSFTVYDGTDRWTLSRGTLCGGTSEEALWNMLEKNPRIAALLRPGVATSVDKKGRTGKAVHSYRSSLTDAMFDKLAVDGNGNVTKASARKNDAQVFDGIVKSYLFDKPMFLATVAMMRPQEGRTRSSMRSQTKYAMNDIRQWLIELAARRYRGNPVNMSEEIRKKFDITEETLVSRGGMEPESAHGWFVNNPKTDKSTGMVYAFNAYVNDIAAMMADGGWHDAALQAAVDIRDRNSKSKADHYLEFDRSSVALAVDVRQTMTGAKTETSTAIEGGLTQQNTGLALYAMGIKDHYSLLTEGMEAGECAPFAGGITNAIDENGEFVRFSGDPADIPKLMAMVADGDYLVVEATDPKWVKEDETLAHNDRQIPSLSRMALVKRSKSAEKFNLKAKKAGDDGKDSITKSVRYSANSQMNLSAIRSAYESRGIFGAKLALASIIREADGDEGYDDMDFSDYLDIADVMVMEAQDGSGYAIRTPGEISLTIRMNLDQDIADTGIAEDIIADAHQVADSIGSQETKIGKQAQQLSLMLFASKSRSSYSSSTWKPVKNPAMSSEERSYGLLKEIMSGQQNVKIPWSDEVLSDPKARAPLSDRKRESLDRKFRSKRPIPKWTPNAFQIVGYIGEGTYRDNLRSTVSIGPRAATYIDKGASQDQIDSVLKRGYMYGMTVIFPDPGCLGDKYEVLADDISETASGQYMLSFFNMRLNGMHTGQTVAMAPASFQYDPSNLWYTVEDSRNLYGLGDSQILTSKHAAERVQCVAADEHSMDIDDFFYNTREAFQDRCQFPQLATRDQIEEYLIKWKDGGPEFDLGIAPSNKNFGRKLEKLRVQLEEYRQSFAMADEQYGILPDARPDRIVGWMVMYVDGRADPIFAPIIPWPTGSSLSAPTRFSVDGIYLDPDTDTVNLDWRISEDIPGQIAKVHDGFGGAGKGMTMLNDILDLGRLRSGHFIDAIVAAASFASRRLAWGKRMCTVKSLAMTMSLPPYGYNYAEHDASFPDNPDVKEDLMSRRIPMEEWPDLLGRIKRFSSDPAIDNLLRDLVTEAVKTGTTNPSDILATKFGDEYSYMYVDYDFFFGTKIEFQNTLMKWYHSMQPTVCPPSIEEFGDGGYLFRPVTYADGISDEYEYGCLQMAVPHKNPNTGGIFYHWENVYISMSFFNDDFSGLHKPGLNGSHRSMEQNNAIAMSGRSLTKKQMRAYAKNTAGIATRTYNPYDLELDYSRFMKKREA